MRLTSPIPQISPTKEEGQNSLFRRGFSLCFGRENRIDNSGLLTDS